MSLKHAALYGATALLFALGLGAGFTDTQSDTAASPSLDCGSLLAPDTTATAFKHEVTRGGAIDLAEVYADLCHDVRATRQVPTYSALGLGLIGLFASSIALGRGPGSRCLEPLP